jgi:hypothetical protein
MNTTPPNTLKEHTIAGKTLAEWKQMAKRDDCLERMVPSDLRELLKHINQQKQPMGDYNPWLIERRDENGKPTWLCSGYLPEFTDNAWKALHFGRQEDAEEFADSDGSDYVLYITRHGFPSPVAAQPSAVVGEEEMLNDLADFLSHEMANQFGWYDYDNSQGMGLAIRLVKKYRFTKEGA